MKKQYSLISLSVLLMLAGTSVSHADDGGFFSSFTSFFDRKKEVMPVKNEVYNEECGDCHFHYQPGFLPEASWRKLMAAKALEDHFGENAELDEDVRSEMETFLVNHSADKSSFKRSKKVMASLKDGEAPLRITDVRYIRRKHHEIPEKLIKQKKVKSLSYCDACHTKADEANYDDDTVVIPNHGNWTW